MSDARQVMYLWRLQKQLVKVFEPRPHGLQDAVVDSERGVGHSWGALHVTLEPRDRFGLKSHQGSPDYQRI